MLLMRQILTGVIFIIGGVLCELIVMDDGYCNAVKSGGGVCTPYDTVWSWLVLPCDILCR